MVEYLGSGVPRILRKYPRSVFTFTPNFIRIIFPFESNLDDKQTGGQTGGQTLLTEAQLAVYNIFKKDNMASRQSIADNLGINPSAVQKHIELLKKSGYIQRVGTFKGHWEILK